MRLEISNITVKNFYSVGQVTQTVLFENGKTTLVLGQNPDYGDGVTNGVGKAQPLYAKIKTPTGWTTFKDVGVGDSVCTPDGLQTLVVGKYPQGKKDIYELESSDGRKVRACDEHLWEVYRSNGSRYIADTKTLRESLENGEEVFIETIAETFDKASVTPIPEYLLGAYLVGGAVSSDGRMYFVNLDERIEENIIRSLKGDYLFKKDGLYSYLIPKHTDYVMNAIQDMFLDSVLRIPDVYKNSSSAQRRELIRGIFDVKAEQDEEVVKVFLPDSEDILGKDIRELCWSLGGLASLKFVSYSIKKPSRGLSDSDKDIILTAKFTNSNRYFTLEEKRDYPLFRKLFFSIKNIRHVGEEEAACIKVLDENHLYITDNYVRTHNTTIINALSYALFGKPITNVKQNNMINNINGKNMLVTIDFAVNGAQYHLERGRKPNVIKFIRNDEGKETNLLEDENNESLGENADTQRRIEQIIGVSPLLFKHIIAMNTYATPFMASKASEQREIIEEILGIGVLSVKAEKLGAIIKQTKIDIDKEEIRVKTLHEANMRTERTIESLRTKITDWEDNKTRTVAEYESGLADLLQIDIETDIANHEYNKTIDETKSKIDYITRELASMTRYRDTNIRNLTSLGNQLDSFEKNVCPTCTQEIDGDAHEKHKAKISKEIEELISAIDEQDAKIKEYQEVLDSVGPMEGRKDTVYRNIADAYGHKTMLDTMAEKIAEKKESTNPYLEQLKEMEESGNGIQEIDYSMLQTLEDDMKHQKFLQKMLTNRDSFVRKRIIDQSLPYLNNRLAGYLESLSLPHKVVFDPNLTFSISDKGRELDFDNLSRGEQNRTILSLNLAFRDLYENLVGPVNIVFVDELLDFGMDTVGAREGLKILKSLARERNKEVFMVTHKDELREHVADVIVVRKENNFTTYETSKE